MPPGRAGSTATTSPPTARARPICWPGGRRRWTTACTALDGRTRWVRARVRPEQLGDGSVRFAGILSDITQQREAEDDLRLALADLAEANARLDAARGRAIHLAMTDALTGAANRRHVDRVLTDLLRTSGPAIGVLLLDIDDFKDINDRHGHRVGDEVLIEVVGRLRSAVRPDDIVARWGGEEFLLLCRAEQQRERARDRGAHPHERRRAPDPDDRRRARGHRLGRSRDERRHRPGGGSR